MRRAHQVRLLLSLLILLACGVLEACGGDDEGETSTTPPSATTPAPAAPPSTSINLTGNYRGTFASTAAVNTGTIAVTFFQTAGNPSITGTITFTGSPCFRAGTVVGTLSGMAFEGLVQFGGGIQITLMATVSSDGLSATGGYAVNMNSTACSRDQGQFTIVRQP